MSSSEAAPETSVEKMSSSEAAPGASQEKMSSSEAAPETSGEKMASSEAAPEEKMASCEASPEANQQSGVALEASQEKMSSSVSASGDSELTMVACETEFEYLTEIPDDLLCIICSEVVKEPFKHESCGKLICKECMEKDGDQPCPHCKQEPASYCFDSQSNEAVESIGVKCTNTDTNTLSSEVCCGWEGTLSTIAAHVVICKFVYIPCPNHCTESGVVTMMQRKDVPEHLEKHCTLRDFVCEHCGENGTYGYITQTHLEACLVHMVPCQHPGCDQQVQHQHLARHLQVCLHGLVYCKYKNIGCTEVLKRKALARHEEKTDKTHFHLALEAVRKLVESSINLETMNAQLVWKIAHLEVDFQALQVRIAQLKEKNDAEARKQRDEPIRIHCVEKNMKDLVQLGKNTFFFMITNFQRERETGKTFTSQPFYSRAGSCGYLMVIEVSHIKNRSDESDPASDCISIFAKIVDGKFDDEISWPFVGDINFMLLNQEYNVESDVKILHHVRILHVKAEDNMIRGVMRGFPEFISQDELQTSTYLVDDALHFQIVVVQPRAWLT